MPSMITICPGCSRKGIMSKDTGNCFHCNKAAGLTSAPKARKKKAATAKVATVGKAVVITTVVPAPAPKPIKKKSPLGRLGKRILGGRVIG